MTKIVESLSNQVSINELSNSLQQINLQSKLNYFEKTPDVWIKLIASNLIFNEIANFSRVCKRFSVIVRASDFYCELIRNTIVDRLCTTNWISGEYTREGQVKKIVEMFKSHGDRVNALNIKLKDGAIEIVKTLPKLINITSLKIHGSYYNNSIGKLISNLQSLQSLDMYNNNLSDSDAKNISNLTNLTHLHITLGYPISESGLFSIMKLEKLTYLYLDSCKYIPSLCSNISKLNLTTLGLSNSDISDESCEYLSKMKSLTVLDLYECSKIEDEGLRDITELTNLTKLDIGLSGWVKKTKISEKGLTSLCNLKKLEELNLHNRSITDTALSRISQIKAIKHLDISYCGDITDKGIKYLLSLSLNSLVIDGCKFGENGLTFISLMKSLDVLRARQFSNLSDPALGCLSKLPNLTSLDLSSCKTLSKCDQTVFSKFINLTSLDLGSSFMMSDSVLQSLVAIKKLRYLRISVSKDATNGIKALEEEKKALLGFNHLTLSIY